VPLKEISKIKSNGTFKWRGCIRGDRLIKGLDYGSTFSPTVRWQTMRTVIASAASKQMIVTSADVTQAYGCAKNPHDWYTYMPKGLRGRPEYVDANGNDMICKVGNLYGGPPAGRHWYFEADSTLKAYGLEQSAADPCLYTCRVGNGGWLYICIYVDDLLIVSSTNEDRNDFLAFWQDKFPCSTSDGLEFEYLGANISVSTNGIKLSSERYIKTLVGNYSPGGVHGKYSVPADKLIVQAVESATDKKAVPDQIILKRFQSLVGALLYVSISTRPDIQFATSMLSRCMAYPNDDLLTMAERVLQYLHHTSALGLFYSSEVESDPHLSGMSDANFSSRRSTSGYVLSIANAAVSFVSKKQVSTALSTCEAVIYAASLAALEAVFLRSLLTDLGFEPKTATLLRVDNSSTIDVAKDPMLHNVTKHIHRRELKIRELVADKTIEISFVPSQDNVADIFTKPLDRKAFQKLRNIMMNNFI
jgi:histone deacetylase 1/2